jgi:hypothetical protein
LLLTPRWGSPGRADCGSGPTAASVASAKTVVVAFAFSTGSFIDVVVRLARLNGQAVVLVP